MMKRGFARWVLTVLGWKIDGIPPVERRFVLIAAPHTSNWDFPLMLLYAAAFGLKIKWLAKDSLFWPPLGWFMRFMGGIPVERHHKKHLVHGMKETFDAADELVLAVPVEGTRALAQFWKSGFYHIAQGAGVPIVPSYLDYGRKRGGFGPPLTPTGDLSRDMDVFRAFYAPMAGKFPELFGPIRLREEDSP